MPGVRQSIDIRMLSGFAGPPLGRGVAAAAAMEHANGDLTGCRGIEVAPFCRWLRRNRRAIRLGLLQEIYQLAMQPSSAVPAGQSGRYIRPRSRRRGDGHIPSGRPSPTGACATARCICAKCRRAAAALYRSTTADWPERAGSDPVLVVVATV